ncbi:MAG: hypothetical protein IJ214_01055 [Clostridia bacterium]|nr:hypothetical protein [Clostridia bacterium]
MSKKKIKRPQQYKRPQERTFKDWWQAQSGITRKRIVWGCAAILAVIVLLLVYYFAIYDDGSIKVRDNALVDVQENWLVGQRSSGKNSTYYHFADVSTPEGYTPAGSALATELQQTFSFEKDNITVSVNPVNGSVDEVADSVYSRIGAFVGENGSVGTLSEYQSKLGACKYFIYTTAYTLEDGSDYFSKSLVLYAPSSFKDGCILISVASQEDLAEDAMLTEAITALDAVTLPAGK